MPYLLTRSHLSDFLNADSNFMCMKLMESAITYTIHLSSPVLTSHEICNFFSVFVPFVYYIVNTISSSCDIDEPYCALLISLCGWNAIPYKGRACLYVEFC